MSTSFYVILGIPATALTDQVKEAYRKCLLKTHPDKKKSNPFPHNTEQIDNDLIARIKEAYATLVDPVRRDEYDTGLSNSAKQQGLLLTGDGLDVYTLDDFEECDDSALQVWRKNCPRCQAPRSIELSEEMLESHGTPDGRGGFEIIVQCSSCSLWIRVEYMEG